MHFHSQDGQDKFVANLFDNKKNGFFLDIGAHDGVNLSNSFFLEKNLSWQGICVEPNPVIFLKLKANRKCVCLNCCAGDKKGTYQFLAISGEGSMLSGLLNFMDKDHLERIEKTIRDHGDTKTIIDVPTLPLSDILAEHAVTIVDYCNIDVEGGEMSVLKSIDFSRVQIRAFTIENNNGGRQVRQFLAPHGYSLIAKLGVDEVYELHSKRYDLMVKWRIRAIIDRLRRSYSASTTCNVSSA